MNHWVANLLAQVTGILSWIVRSWTDVENNIVSVERVNEYADTAKEVSDAKHISDRKTLRSSPNTATELILMHTLAATGPFRPTGQSRAALYHLTGPKMELCSSMTTGCSIVKALSLRSRESP